MTPVSFVDWLKGYLEGTKAQEFGIGAEHVNTIKEKLDSVTITIISPAITTTPGLSQFWPTMRPSCEINGAIDCTKAVPV